VDLLIAGAVPDENNFVARFNAIHTARGAGHVGSRAIGASFHHRRSALISLNYNCLDINYIRYNTAHPGAVHEIFPYLRQDRTGLIYNFKSMMSQVTAERFQQLGFNENHWLPKPTDHYRFVLSDPHIDGILCSLSSPEQVGELLTALDEKPLTPDEQRYMAWLSSLANPRYF
jgi:aryl-alcohol dehydrogenase-like predicted oxidoreductase